MKVVERIEERAGQMDASGAMLLVDDLGTQIEAAFKKSLYGRLVIQWDFRKYAYVSTCRYTTSWSSHSTRAQGLQPQKSGLAS